jgi:hypothetical protein
VAFKLTPVFIAFKRFSTESTATSPIPRSEFPAASNPSATLDQLKCREPVTGDSGRTSKGRTLTPVSAEIQHRRDGSLGATYISAISDEAAPQSTCRVDSEASVRPSLFLLGERAI